MTLDPWVSNLLSISAVSLTWSIVMWQERKSNLHYWQMVIDIAKKIAESNERLIRKLENDNEVVITRGH